MHDIPKTPFPKRAQLPCHPRACTICWICNLHHHLLQRTLWKILSIGPAISLCDVEVFHMVLGRMTAPTPVPTRTPSRRMRYQIWQGMYESGIVWLGEVLGFLEARSKGHHQSILLVFLRRAWNWGTMSISSDVFLPPPFSPLCSLISPLPDYPISRRVL